MISRNTLVCDSCGAYTTVRTGIGHADHQEHRFPCPGCGVEVTYALRLNQKNVTYEYLPPTNAHWAASPDGVASVLTFYPGVPVPDPGEPLISPFIATFHNYRDYPRFAGDEATRQFILTTAWPSLERGLVHYDSGRHDLFSAEVSRLVATDPLTTQLERRRLLAALLHHAFRPFTGSTPGMAHRITQRFALASAIDPTVLDMLAAALTRDDRLRRLCLESRGIRDSFIELYPHLQPLVATRYWHLSKRERAAISLPDKAFLPLRQFYVDCFETTCRMLVPALAIESLIVHNSLDVPTKKGARTVRDLYEMDNAPKVQLLSAYPIGDLFAERVNARLRNGVGHNAAHHDARTDRVVYYTRAKGADQEHRLTYTGFCAAVLEAFAAFELAAIYFDTLDIHQVALSAP